MTKNPVIFSLFEHNQFKGKICNKLHYEAGEIVIHHFPDEEIMITINSDVRDRTIIFILSLDRPNDKMMPLILAAETARDLGARKIGLIAPYLAYMRQDKEFHPGEGITSKYFAKLLSTYFDWFTTIDPHLHRWHSLKDVFTIDTTLLHSTHYIANWVKNNVTQPLLIGPDEESTQWVAEIAKIIQAPFLIVKKTRIGDAAVSATVPHLEEYPNYMPVLIDDIISTGATMIETIKHIKGYKTQHCVCLGVHAIFANNAYEDIVNTGIAEIITCNTIEHSTNKIDLSDLIIDAIKMKI